LRIGNQFVVSRLVDQYLNNRQNEILWKILANPADNGHLYGYNLQQLTKDFPHSGLLQALLARANKGEGMQHAAASFNPKALYVMMNAYDNMADVSSGQIVQELGSSLNYAGAIGEEHVSGYNDFSNGQLKDILGFEPQTGNGEGVAEKVVVGDDEQQEVENITIASDAEHRDEPQAELLTAFQEADAETINEIIIPETEDEPITEIADVYESGAEPVTEVPIEDDKVHMHTSPFEEEVVDWHAPETEKPVTEIADIYEGAEPIAEIPADDHRADTLNAVFEEEIIELHQQATDEPVTEIEEIEEIHERIDLTEPEIEIAAENHRSEIENQPLEEEIIELPETMEEVNETEEAKNAAEPLEGIDDEIYDEIADIDFSSMFPRKTVEEVVPEVVAAAELPESITEPVSGEVENETDAEDMHEEIEELIPDSIAGTDYFVFEKAEQVNEEPGVTEYEAVVSEHKAINEPIGQQTVFETETQDVSKYHDEKMPYSFMWWLDKTRKEHASVYQPFKLDTTQAIKHTADGTLQQQYYENIFHITTVAELDASKQSIPFDPENKEDRLIKKFIIEEPHISTPSGDKLDNENKAKKSAEDQDEMVTETLARIYIDQMLYHKAINTYKKLMLKFPEKSRYFADQIELLERKIN
jgi:hypothetical protein